MKKKLFKVQLKECRVPLIVDSKVRWNKPLTKLFSFDPTELYLRINEANLLDPFKRHHTVSLTFLFQSTDGRCACGCNKLLIGKQKKWASRSCRDFGFNVFCIISGRTRQLRQFRSAFIGGYKCETCGLNDSNINYELDHVVPVKFGGGGGWLSNYQFKCKKCHREKTNKDFGFKQQ